SMLLLGTMAIGGLVTLALKRIVARARPDLLLEQGLHGLGAPFAGEPYDSFPSSHTLTAFAVAAVIGHIAPRWRLPVLALAAVVARSEERRVGKGWRGGGSGEERQGSEGCET